MAARAVGAHERRGRCTKQLPRCEHNTQCNNTTTASTPLHHCRVCCRSSVSHVQGQGASWCHCQPDEQPGVGSTGTEEHATAHTRGKRRELTRSKQTTRQERQCHSALACAPRALPWPNTGCQLRLLLGCSPHCQSRLQYSTWPSSGHTLAEIADTLIIVLQVVVTSAWGLQALCMHQPFYNASTPSIDPNVFSPL